MPLLLLGCPWSLGLILLLCTQQSWSSFLQKMDGDVFLQNRSASGQEGTRTGPYVASLWSKWVWWWNFLIRSLENGGGTVLLQIIYSLGDKDAKIRNRPGIRWSWSEFPCTPFWWQQLPITVQKWPTKGWLQRWWSPIPQAGSWGTPTDLTWGTGTEPGGRGTHKAHTGKLCGCAQGKMLTRGIKSLLNSISFLSPPSTRPDASQAAGILSHCWFSKGVQKLLQFHRKPKGNYA